MRIIAGTKRGMGLISPKSQVSRPITDRVKESLFSVLYKYDLPGGAVVADLFAGVGSLGLESLSRGARFVAFVEQNPHVFSVLKKNIQKSGFGGQCMVTRGNAFKLGAPVESGRGKYELVFVDPPYAVTGDAGQESRLGRLMDLLAGQVAPGAIAVVRTSESTEPVQRYGPFDVIERRKWGAMAVTILRKAAG
ncbi:MAG: RsmD family RNA methyltransferase [Phycisphaerales bacterium]|nr:MAG: RsmD family RNA methyltransferase [Phycisphaerales bacterium]